MNKIVRITLFLLLLCNTRLFANNKKTQQEFHRFLITLNSISYQKVYTGEILKIIPNGYKKGRIRFNLLQIRILSSIRPSGKDGIYYTIFRRNTFKFKAGEKYLFFATKNNKLSYLDPPLKIKKDKLSIDDATYPISKAIQWIKKSTAINRRKFLKRNRRFLSAKRTRNRKASFRLKMLQKEILLLYKINNTTSLNEKASLLLELGHTRLRLEEYKTARNAFIYVKRKFLIKPIIELLAERGLALITFYTKGSKAGIKTFKKLLQHPSGKKGYHAVLHLDLGRIYEKAGRSSLAIQQYTKAATDYPHRHKERAFALFNLGELHRKKREHQKALSYYRKAYSIFNRHIAAIFRKRNARFPTWYFVMKRRIARKGK